MKGNDTFCHDAQQLLAAIDSIRYHVDLYVANYTVSVSMPIHC